MVLPTPKRAAPETFEVTITYLEQGTRPAGPPPARPAKPTALMRVVEPPLGFYRYLFDAVGGPHQWVSRRYLDDETLAPLIHTDDVEIYVLYYEGWPAGFAELALHDRAAPEIKFFGLVPEAQGMRLGRWFFNEVLSLAWRSGPQKVCIETCTADNPAALRLYQRMGFSVTGQAKGVIEWRG